MKTVLCIGDSITREVGSSNPRKLSYCAKLQTLLGFSWNVINAGENGATLMPAPNGENSRYFDRPSWTLAQEAAKRAASQNDELIVCVMLGTNDADTLDYGFVGTGEDFRLRYENAFLSDYLFLIRTLRALCPAAKFVLCKSPYSYDSHNHPNNGNLPSVWLWQECAAETCKKDGIPVILLDMAQATCPKEIGGETGISLLYHDRLHPNDSGYLYFARCFATAIRKAERL